MLKKEQSNIELSVLLAIRDAPNLPCRAFVVYSSGENGALIGSITMQSSHFRYPTYMGVSPMYRRVIKSISKMPLLNAISSRLTFIVALDLNFVIMLLFQIKYY